MLCKLIGKLMDLEACLRPVMLVELDLGEIAFEHGTTWVSDVMRIRGFRDPGEIQEITADIRTSVWLSANGPVSSGCCKFHSAN
jgi:hypothetical protein